MNKGIEMLLVVSIIWLVLGIGYYYIEKIKNVKYKK